MAEPHDWHLFDAENNIWVRQTTLEGMPNSWEIHDRNSNKKYTLIDEEFNNLRLGVPLDAES